MRYVVQYYQDGGVTVVGATDWLHYAAALAAVALAAGKWPVVVDTFTGEEVTTCRA